MRIGAFFRLLIISIGLSLFLLYITGNYSRLIELRGEGAIIIAFDENTDDRLIQETLISGGLTGFTSESTVNVFIDDFGRLREIPLDLYHNEILPFDPRNDGFVSELKTFFVRGGSRFLYLFQEDASLIRAESLERRLNQLFPETRFTLSILGRRSLYLATSILILIACLATLLLTRSKRFYSFLIPLFLALSTLGPVSILIIGLLTGVWELLREPLLEISSARHYDRDPHYAGEGISLILFRLKPFKINLFLAFLLSSSIFILSPLWDIPPIYLILGVLFFYIIIIFYFHYDLNAASKKSKKSIKKPFIPVLLFPLKTKTFSLFPLLLPFGIIFPVLIAFPIIISPSLPFANDSGYPSGNPIESRYLISSLDFERHIERARLFSYGVFNPDYNDIRQDEAFYQYNIGDDGLISGFTTITIEDIIVPIFHLEKLMTFLLNYTTDDLQTPGPFEAGDNLQREHWSFILILPMVCLLDLFKKAKKGSKKITILGDRQIAA